MSLTTRTAQRGRVRVERGTKRIRATPYPCRHPSELSSRADRGRRGEVGRELEADAVVRKTGLPTRYYLPKTPVRMGPDADRHGEPLRLQGQAEWWSVRSGDTLHTDLAWSYRTPPESQKIAGLIACYDEKVDVYVDGVLQERPRSRFT